MLVDLASTSSARRSNRLDALQDDLLRDVQSLCVDADAHDVDARRVRRTDAEREHAPVEVRRLDTSASGRSLFNPLAGQDVRDRICIGDDAGAEHRVDRRDRGAALAYVRLRVRQDLTLPASPMR